jgi:hypothetical protein
MRACKPGNTQRGAERTNWVLDQSFQRNALEARTGLSAQGNGAWKHGRYSEAAKAERLILKLLLKDASSFRSCSLKAEQ